MYNVPLIYQSIAAITLSSLTGGITHQLLLQTLSQKKCTSCVLSTEEKHGTVDEAAPATQEIAVPQSTVGRESDTARANC